MNGDQEPVACTLGSGDRAQRAARWTALAARALRRAERTDRGLRLEFRTGPGVADELRALAELERECCAFATWSLRPAGDQLTLEVTGDSPEAVAAAQALFPALA
ncbi:MAG TPA: hypothetical protein VMI33_26910 [Streptosporangiaceae bacterium]|nr:hypothetical protein [Streptosporangiaceae bacterium]